MNRSVPGNHHRVQSVLKMSLMKTFSTRFFSVALITSLGVLAGPLAQGGSANRAEMRNSFRQDVLRIINRDRASFGMPPVKLDPAASEIGDRYCELQIRNGTTGHFTLDGLTPYMRYSFAGGNDGVSENAAAWSANYTFPESSLLDMIRRSQEAMIMEVAPNDGHKRTLLDPEATHVGIGLAWEKGEFRLVHEFIRRYVEFTRPVARAATTNDMLRVEGRPLPGYRVDAVTVYYEPAPQFIAAVTANNIPSYGFPKNRRDYPVEREVRSAKARRIADLADNGSGITVRPDGSFSFNAPYDRGEGIYTVVVWVTRSGSPAPISASNISIRVAQHAQPPLRLLGTR